MKIKHTTDFNRKLSAGLGNQNFNQDPSEMLSHFSNTLASKIRLLTSIFVKTNKIRKLSVSEKSSVRRKNVFWGLR